MLKRHYDRTLGAVRSVDEYVRYLAAKDPRVRVGEIEGVPGRNVVVYCFGY